MILEETEQIGFYLKVIYRSQEIVGNLILYAHSMLNIMLVLIGVPECTLLQLYQSILLVAILVISILWLKNWRMKRRERRLKAEVRDMNRERGLSFDSKSSQEPREVHS